MLFARKKDRQVNPRSATAAIVALGFAIVAGGASAAGAWSLIDIPLYQVVLVAISLLAVWFERSALIWVRVRRARKDTYAANGGIALLMVAFVYTAGMQVVFFGQTMLASVAKDEKAAAGAKDVDKRITELEQRLGWMPRPTSTAAALKVKVASLEKDAGNRQSQFREAALAAAKALGPARTELGAAEAYEAVEADLVAVRAKRARMEGEDKSDVKSAIFNQIFEGQGHAVSFVFIGLAVLLLQMGQILLPALAGSAELAALRATKVDEKPVAADKNPADPPPRTIKTTAPAAAKPLAQAQAKPAAEAAPQAPQGGLAAAAAAMLEQRQAADRAARNARDKRAKEAKATTQPAKMGLASKVS